MLRAVPIRPFSHSFSVLDGDRDVAMLKTGWFSDTGSATIDGRALRLGRENAFSGAFKLELDGAVVAKAYKRSALRNCFEIELEQTHVLLEREGLLGRSFVVRRGEEVLGRIDPESVFTREARIDLPDEWPTALQLFVFWLVLIIWKRMKRN